MQCRHGERADGRLEPSPPMCILSLTRGTLRVCFVAWAKLHRLLACWVFYKATVGWALRLTRRSIVM
jgi:hypothetical protein